MSRKVEIDISGVDLNKIQAIVKALDEDISREELLCAFAHFSDHDLFTFQRMIMTIIQNSHEHLIYQINKHEDQCNTGDTNHGSDAN